MTNTHLKVHIQLFNPLSVLAEDAPFKAFSNFLFNIHPSAHNSSKLVDMKRLPPDLNIIWILRTSPEDSSDTKW